MASDRALVAEVELIRQAQLTCQARLAALEARAHAIEEDAAEERRRNRELADRLAEIASKL